MKKYFIFFLFAFLVSGVINATPNGANITDLGNQTSLTGSPQSVNAVAGNVSEINIFGFSNTQTWQGYFGNVSGALRLADGSSNVMYNWSMTSAQGEVYASRNDSINWAYIQCFNFTASGTYLDDRSNAGGSSRYGLNLTGLENLYNISSTDVDGVNETFNTNDHPQFFTNNLEFSNGECKTAKILNNSGAGVFYETLLYEPLGRSVVFASILQDNTRGFDGRLHDFQMLVLEDGHKSDQSSTPYYFYVELQ